MSASEQPLDPAELLARTRWMRTLARTLVADLDAADDVVQQTWLAFLRSPPSKPSATRAWLARVLRNFAFRRRRAEAHQQRFEERAARPEKSPAGPEELIEQAELHRKAVDLVLALKEPYRSTLLYRFFGEMSAAEIARREGIPETTVRSRISKGLADIRSTLDRAHGGDRRVWTLAFLSLAGWTASDLSAAQAASVALSTTASTARTLALGGLSMTAKKIGIALAASLLLLLGLGSLRFLVREPSRDLQSTVASRIDTRPAAGTLQTATEQAAAPALPASETAPAEAVATDAKPPSLEGKVTSAGGAPVDGARVIAIEAEA